MIIDRKSAKELLAKKQLAQLKDEEKLDILDEYWSYDNEEDLRVDIKDGVFPKINETTITLIAKTESPKIPLPDGIDSLLLDYLIFKLEKVLNNYIAARLNDFGSNYEVEGQVEKAGLCPCCDYYSIDFGEDGLWDICPVCFWENGGDGPNHLSLDVARSNFLKFGAMNEKSLHFIDPEGQNKYAKKI